MQLYEIRQNGNSYCGPSALSAIAGIGTKEAAALLRKINGRTCIKGTYVFEMRQALVKLGFDLRSVSHIGSATKTAQKRGAVTLRQWAKDVARGTDVFLVSAGHHWILVQGRYAICGKTLNLVPVAEHPHARCRVGTACQVTRVRRVNPADVIPKPEPRRSMAGQAAARRLAAQFGIEIERENDYWYVYAPDGLPEDLDPYIGDRIGYTWSEVLDRVETYADLMTERQLAA